LAKEIFKKGLVVQGLFFAVPITSSYLGRQGGCFFYAPHFWLASSLSRTEGELNGHPDVSARRQLPDTNVRIISRLGIVTFKWLVNYVRCVKLLKLCCEDALVEILYCSLARCNTHLNPARHVIDKHLKFAR
jgi:hypothetical protein